MKVNSPKAIDLGRAALREHGDWGRVRESGRVRSDGVIVIKKPAAPAPSSSKDKKDK